MKKWIFCLVVGTALLFLSTGAASDTAVRCDGELMSPGDICETTTRTGEVTSRETYDEVERDTKAAHHTFVTWGRWAMLGGGAVLTVLAIWGIAAQRRRTKNQGPTTADLYFQQQAAAQAPSPAYPPQPQQYQQQPVQQYPPQQPAFPPRPPQPAPQQAAPPQADFGPGSGDDVTQRLR
jgi:type IV secretory pathway VirB10-like protein